MDNGQLTNIVEAMLFAAAEPLSVRAMGRVLEGTKTEDIEYALTELNQRYTQADSSFRIREIAGGWQMCTLPEYAKYIESLLAKTKKQRLSGAALETLAVIAYRQPVTGPEIEKIRGVESSGVLRTLLERKVISIVGRSEKPGRPLLYGTTKEFLYYFGLNHLRELPRVEELEKLLRKHDVGEQIPIGLAGSEEEVPTEQPETGEQPEPATAAEVMEPAPADETAEVTEGAAETASQTEPAQKPESPAAESVIDDDSAPDRAAISIEIAGEEDPEASPIPRLVLKKTTPETVDSPKDLPADPETAESLSPVDEEEAVELPIPRDETEEETEILRTAEEIVSTPVE